jgi:hypothetical protein
VRFSVRVWVCRPKLRKAGIKVVKGLLDQICVLGNRSDIVVKTEGDQLLRRFARKFNAASRTSVTAVPTMTPPVTATTSNPSAEDTATAAAPATATDAAATAGEGGETAAAAAAATARLSRLSSRLSSVRGTADDDVGSPATSGAVGAPEKQQPTPETAKKNQAEMETVPILECVDVAFESLMATFR